MSLPNGIYKRVKSKSVMTNEFIFEIKGPNGYTMRSSLPEIHIYIHISIRNPVRRPRENTVVYSTETSHGERL